MALNKYGIKYSTTDKIELAKMKEWPYQTPRHIVDAGMKLCDECAALNPLENQRCCECGEFIVMFVTPTQKK